MLLAATCSSPPEEDANVTSAPSTIVDSTSEEVASGQEENITSVPAVVGGGSSEEGAVVEGDGTQGQVSVQSRVSAADDDAEESESGSMSLNSSDLELIFDKSDQTVGIRFESLPIPGNAAIMRAYIQFKVDETTSENTVLTIHGESRDNAAPFTTASYNISSRNRTSAYASWTPPAWNSVAAAGVDQRTSDLTPVVQEIVSRPGWNSGNAMAFIFTGVGQRIAEAYDGDAAGAPLLHVEFSTDASAAAPVITLIGNDLINLNVGDAFDDPGATAQDTRDGDLTEMMKSSSNVNTSTAGSYTVDYSVTDSDGNTASATRSVVVTASGTDPNILNVPDVYPTLQDALSHAVDGNTILLAPGTYKLSATLYVDKHNITIASRYLTTSDASYIDSTVILGDPALHMIDGVLGKSANLKILGLTLRDGRKGVSFYDDYGEIHNSKLYDIRSDAISFENDAGGAVTYCRVENAGDDAVDIDTRHNGSFMIAHNEFIDSGDDSIEVHLFAHSGINMHYDIHDNLLAGAYEDGIQLIDYDDDSDRTFDIYRNIFQNMKDVAISAIFEVTTENFLGSAMTERVRIFNNYFYNNGYHITGGDNMIILNNIFEGAATRAIFRAKGNSIVDHNLFYNGTDTPETVTGTKNLYANPLKNSDFTLQKGSPAIDSGTAGYTYNSETVLTIPLSEYTGTDPDMGRYEYGLAR